MAGTTAAGETEYVRTLVEVCNTPECTELYEFTRTLNMAKVPLTGSNNTLILPADPPIVGIFIER